MRRLTLSVVVTAVLGLAAYTMAGAQGPRFGGPGGEGPRGGFGRGGWPALRGIELSDDQKAQIRAIRDAERQSQEGPPAALQLHRQLQSEVFAESPDAQRLAALQQQVLQAQAAELAKRIALEQKLAKVLTPEQRASVRERLAQEPSRGRWR
ncbi:MAG: Spy/CpxP family protein refolding chaperone [Vicinamibacterales bacterium]